jgi:hypothetical protein
MIVVRIFPAGELEETWNKVLSNLDSITNNHCSPLYLSQREEEKFMTLVYEVREADSLADILVKNIPLLIRPEKTRTITLLKPVFFPAPKDRPANLQRYQVSIRTKPEKTEGVYNHVLHLDYPKDAFPTYAAYSFGEDDILTSMLSTSTERLKEFAREHFEQQEGVVSIEIGHINRSQRVAPMEMWRKYRESKYLFKPTAEQEEYDYLEYSGTTRAPAREAETSSFW